MVFDEQIDSFMPVFYVLLTSKTQQMYQHSLHWVKITANNKMRPTTVTCDFEKALHNVIRIEFPTAIVKDCLFHWKQAIGRKIRDLKFDKPIDKRMMTRYVLETLTIVPVDEIEKYGIPYVCHSVEANCNQNDLD